jgi:hypothetical protein
MKPYCCYAKGILCVYASSYGGCLCSTCINQEVKQSEKRKSKN